MRKLRHRDIKWLVDNSTQHTSLTPCPSSTFSGDGSSVDIFHSPVRVHTSFHFILTWPTRWGVGSYLSFTEEKTEAQKQRWLNPGSWVRKHLEARSARFQSPCASPSSKSGRSRVQRAQKPWKKKKSHLLLSGFPTAYSTVSYNPHPSNISTVVSSPSTLLETVKKMGEKEHPADTSIPSLENGDKKP